MDQPPPREEEISADTLDVLPTRYTQQENVTRESASEEIITVEDEVTRGGSAAGTSTTAPMLATKTAADGTIRARLVPRRQQEAAAVRSAGALSCSGDSAPTAERGCSAVEGIAVGRIFPFMGDADSTWANVEEIIRDEVGGRYPIRRNNRQKLFRCRDEHEKSLPNRWSTVRMECAQAGTPVKSPLSEDLRKRRSTSSKKISCNWRVIVQWPQRTNGPYISKVHLRHDTPFGEEGQNGQEHPPPRAFDNELSKEEIQRQEDKIKDLVEAGMRTTDLHKFLQRDGKRLGEQGKQKVRNIRRRHQLESAPSGLASPIPPAASSAAAIAAAAAHQQREERQETEEPPLSPPPPPPSPPPSPAPPPPTPPDNGHFPASTAATPTQSSSRSACTLGSSNGPHSVIGPATNGANENGVQASNGGAPSNCGAPSYLEGTKYADCVAFAKELASTASEITSREAMNRVIAHARVAADTAIRVEVQCQGQGRRAGSG